ncbi:MAG: Aldose 1-epimerase [Bacteroidetes bacterium]|uniref:aldose epimerase family protein n=1 Tax=unclassified Chitinophaga TaxID=2619133 RepID=UPI0009FB3C9B|nr:MULTISPECIES: aldose epimerase family protein [unclassified Chitinophaga]MBP1652094.1 Aldose 1-epimerase [Bacteroidota bacterium]WPV68443.1 aldose epimerase family protein [Chitinophaga sp. LS1]
MKNIIPLLTVAAAVSLSACQSGTKSNNNSVDSMQTTKDSLSIEGKIPAARFDSTVDGKQTKLYYLKSKGNVQVAITNYGGKIVSLLAPDKSGKLEDVELGYDNISRYVSTKERYYGGIVGRYGNRIAKGKFKLDGKEYTLATNNNQNHLHGGKKGFNDVVWDAEQTAPNSLKLHYVSKDGEEGYPGNLDITLTYTLTDSNELKIDYSATTDKATVVNLTNHSFFNLHGAGNGDINDLILTINADKFTPVDSTLIPTGKLEAVKGTPMDFTTPTKIGERVDADFEQLKFGRGYDHNYVLNKKGNELSLAAKVEDPTSGRTLEVWTTEPGVQFYGGNFLDGTDKGKDDKTYVHRGAFCLETQHFPDSPNQPAFPSVVLKPGATYTSECIYKFGVK